MHAARGVAISRLRPRSGTAGRIETTALRLFHEQGFLATTMREIAAHSGVTPGAIYNHYESKHDILYSIIRIIHDQLDRALFDAVAQAGSRPEDQLAALVHAFVLYNTQAPEEAGVANREYKFLPKPLRADVVAMRRRVRSMFQSPIEAGQKDGTMLAASGLGSGANILAMMIINMSITASEWYRRGGPLTPNQFAELYARLAVRMVRVLPG